MEEEAFKLLIQILI